MGSKESQSAFNLRRNLVATIVGGIVLAAGIAVLTLAIAATGLLHDELSQRAGSEARALAASLSGPLARGHMRTAANAVEDVMDTQDLVESTVVDTTGRVVVSTDTQTVGGAAAPHHAAVGVAGRPILFAEGSSEAGDDAILWVVPIFGERDAETDAAPLMGTVAVRFSTTRMGAALVRSVGLSALLVLLGAALIGGGLYWVLMRNAVRPIEALLTGVGRMGEGDLGARVRTGELGALGGVGRALNGMWEGFGSLAGRVTTITDRIQSVSETLGGAMGEIEDGSHLQEEAAEETASMLARVNTSIRDVNGQIETLSRSTEEASSSTLELAASVDEVARSVTSLNTAVESASSSSHEMGASIRQVAESSDEVQRMAEETAASMTQMDRAIQEVGNHVAQASELTEKVAHGAEEGTGAVAATIAGIEEIRSLTGESHSVLGRLVERIGKIDEILTVIGGINDETNLLSLNAAIIAAQAGEQGKAFAVVANHVKTLAQRTAMSTQEIEGLIRSVQDESGNAMTAMEAGIEAVETGVQRSRKAGDSLSKIRDLAGDANSRVTEIARAAQEQGRNSQHVADAANRTSAMVQRISGAMAEQSAASEQLLHTSESSLVVCRQVQRSTEEQRESTAFITESITAIGEMMRNIQEKMANHQQAGEGVSEVVDRVLEVARKTGSHVPEIVAIVEALRRDAEALHGEIDRFGGTAAEPTQPEETEPPSSPESAAQSPA
jgi:methyl-accepting chemotaxis protein